MTVNINLTSACGERDKAIWFIRASIAYHYNCPPCDRHAALQLKRSTDTADLDNAEILAEVLAETYEPVELKICPPCWAARHAVLYQHECLAALEHPATRRADGSAICHCVCND